MKVLRVINNNVVLSQKRDGTEVVLTGWGIGYKKRPGDPVDEAKLTRIFVPEDHADTIHMAGLLASIPLDFLNLASRALDSIRVELPVAVSSATVVALADHLHMAVQRQSHGTSSVANPLASEILNLYPTEYRLAVRLLEAINAELPQALPVTEQAAIAIHLVNAGFRTSDVSATFAMTEVFAQLFQVIENSFDLNIEITSVNAARFITHMRYFFIRLEQGQQLNENNDVLWTTLSTTHPEAMSCAQKLASVLALRFGESLHNDEIAYLALHVARLVDDTKSS